MPKAKATANNQAATSTTPAKIVQATYKASAVPKTPIFMVEERSLRNHMSERKAAELGLSWDGYIEFHTEYVRPFDLENLTLLLEKLDLVVIERKGSHKQNVDILMVASASCVPEFMRTKGTPIERMLSTQFEVANFEGNRKNSFAYILGQILAKALNRKVILSVPHGKYRAYSDRGAFQVNVWSTPDPAARREGYDETPYTMFKIPVSHPYSPFKPIHPYFGEGYGGIFIKSGHYVVAELLPNALYIHHDLVEDGAENEMKIMLKIVQEVLKHLLDPDAFANALEGAKKAFGESQTKLYRDLVMKSIPRRTKRTEASIIAAEAEAVRLLKRYFEAAREAFQLRNAAPNPSTVADRFTQEFQKLQNGSVALIERTFLKSGSYDNTIICIHTEPITVVNPSTRNTHLLGRFRIELHLSDGSIRFLNRDELPATCNHQAPHVKADGDPCLGNIRGEISGYIANYEIEAAATLAIAYLQSVDMTDPYGILIAHFPVILEAA